MITLSRAVVVALASLLIGTLVVSDASALEVTLPISDISTISPGLGGARILLDHGSMGALSEELVLSAHLVLPLSGNTPVTDIDIAVAGLSRAWGAGVAWASPWTAPGGDVDPDLVSVATLEAGRPARVLDVDVTDMIRAIAAGSAAANGLILKPAGSASIGFTRAQMAVLGSLEGGEIQVTYRSLTAHGMRGGPGALMARKRQARQHTSVQGDR